MSVFLAKLALTTAATLVPLASTHMNAPAALTTRAVSVPLVGTSFPGSAAIGALMWQGADGRPAKRLCSAAAVHSPGGDLIVTAAHCVRGVNAGSGPMTIAYVPGYHNVVMPYGYWIPTKIIRDAGWTTGHDPDHDVAFLVVAQPGSGKPLESTTGAEYFGGLPPARTLGVLVGYPNHAAVPVACRNLIKYRSATQLEFSCAGFPGGTSGGPLLANVARSTGIGTIVGVIGGYQNGGSRSFVSYCAVFGQDIAALYAAARDQS
jgi:V8-like Glu-specific endopeptidase